MYRSEIKKSLAFTEIEKLVSCAFGSKARVKGWKELKGGTLNTIYELDINHPRLKTILKVSPNIANYPHIERLKTLETEVTVCPQVRGYLQIPAPEIYYSDFSGNQIDHHYFFMERFSGVPLFRLQRKLPSESRKHLNHQLGSIASKLHNLKGDRFGHFLGLKDQSNGVWKETFFSSFSDSLARIKKNNIALHKIIGISSEDLFQHLNEEAFIFGHVFEPSLIHGDLWNGNIFIRQEKDKWSIEGIIDWEFSRWADPLFECPFYFGSKNRGFLEGYGEETGDIFHLSDSQRRRTIWYRLGLFLIMLNEPADRGYKGLAAKLSALWVRKNLKNTYARLVSR